MGVLNFYKRFIVDYVKKQYPNIEIESVENPYSVLLDANGLLYDVANSVYGLTQTDISGRRRNQDELQIIQRKLDEKGGEEFLKNRFSDLLKSVLTKNIIELLKPSELLIIAFDGKAFRAKQKQQRTRRFLAGKKKSDIFDVGQFTVGTQFLSFCCEIINEWIYENKEDLPAFVYFSPCSEEGEAEHKIFGIFESAIEKIEKEYRKNENYVHDLIPAKFQTANHVVIGKDSDLFFLMLTKYKYKFYWFKDTSAVFARTPRIIFTDVQLIISYIEERMLNSQSKQQVVRDFVLMSFLIGDDFVPGNFSFDLHIGFTLSRMMKIYKDGNFHLTRTKKEDLLINLEEFTRFLSHIKDLEFELFLEKKKIQVMEIAKDPELNNVKAEMYFDSKYKFVQSNFLEMEYPDFVENWKKYVACPNYFKLSKKERKKIDRLGNVWDEEYNDYCESFITGLQWNISCYYGVTDLSDWAYNWCFAPSIFHLHQYLNQRDKKAVKLHRSESRQEITLTGVFLTLFNIHSSKQLINRTITTLTKKSSLDKNIVLEKYRLPHNFEAYNPESFQEVFEGKYFKDGNKYGETILIPFVPIELQTLIPKSRADTTCGDIEEYGIIPKPIVKNRSKVTKMYSEIFEINGNEKKEKKKK